MQLKELAKHLGVSTYAVSVALSGKKGVSESTRQKIISAARQFGYSPDNAARMLRSGKSHQIGVAIPAPVELFYARMITLLQQELSAQNFTPLFAMWGSGGSTSHDAFSMLARNKLDGLITWEYSPDLALFRCPIVLYQTSEGNQQFDSVTIDYELQMRDVTADLFRKGCRRIGYVGCLDDPRAIALKNELKRNQLEYRQEYFLQFPFRQWNDLPGGMRKLAELDEPPDALAVTSDQLALFADAYLSRTGQWRPHIVSLCDSELLPLFAPSVTVCSLCKKELASNLVRLMMRRIREPARPLEHIVLKSHFIKKT